LRVPFAIHVDNSMGNNSDQVITAVSFDPPGGAAHLRRPDSSVHDYTMSGGSSTSLPFELVENHVYVDVMLNGKGPYHMIFDTGGQNIIDPAVAQEVGATAAGSLQGSGVGAKTETFSIAQVKTLSVGNAVLRDQVFAVAPVRAGFGVSAGRPADGLIGWEVLARYVTTFDYAKGRVVLAMPGAPPLTGNAHVVPFVFNGTQPQIACGVDGIASQCTIDTGARDTMSFYTPFLKAHPDVIPATTTANGITGFGVGGPAYGRLGRLRDLTIGDLRLNDLVASFTDTTKGAFASEFVAANLGGNLLRRFSVTFDYPHQTMALVPDAAFAEPDQYERSGLFLIKLTDKVTVADVRPGTPAAAAGMAKGDVITSIDGKPTATMDLGVVRHVFFAPAGTVVELGITSKNGGARTVSLTLRNYV
jgi:hypothetical protein